MAKARKPARVRTAEGVEKYDAPVGSLITGKTKKILARLNARLTSADNTNQGTLDGMKPKQLGLFSVPAEPKIPKPKADPKPKPKAPTRRVESVRSAQLDIGDSIVLNDGDHVIQAAQRSDGQSQFRLERPDGTTHLSQVYGGSDPIDAVRVDRPGTMLHPADINVHDSIIGPDGIERRVLSVARSRLGTSSSFRVADPDGVEVSVPVQSYEMVRAVVLTPEEREAYNNRPREWKPNRTLSSANLLKRGDIIWDEDGDRFELDQDLSAPNRPNTWTVVDEDGVRRTMAFSQTETQDVLRFGDDNDARQAWFRENGFVEGTYADLRPGDETVAPMSLPGGVHSGRLAVVRIDDGAAPGDLTVFVSKSPDDVGDVMRVTDTAPVIRRPQGGNKSDRIRTYMRNRTTAIEDFEANYPATKSKDLRTGDEIKLSYDGTPMHVISARYDPDLNEVTMVTQDSRTGSVMTMMKDADIEWRTNAGGARAEVTEFLLVEEARLDGLRDERSAAPTVGPTELETGDIVYWNDELVKYELTAVRQTGEGNASITMRVVDGDNSLRVGETFGQRVGGTSEFHRVTSGAELRAARIQRGREEADIESGENIIANDIVYDPVTKSWARVQSVEKAPDGNYVVRGYLTDTTRSSDSGANYLLTVAPGAKVRMRERSDDQVRAANRNTQQRERRIAQREAEELLAIQDAEMAGKPTPDGVRIGELQRGQVVDLTGDGIPVRITGIDRQGDFTTITGHNTTGPTKGTRRTEGSNYPDDTLAVYADHAERPLPSLPPAARQDIVAKDVVVGDTLLFTTTITPDIPATTRLERNYVPIGAVLEDGSVTISPVTRATSSYSPARVAVRRPDGTTDYIELPDPYVHFSGPEADRINRSQPRAQPTTTNENVNVESVRVLANGKIRVKGEYIYGPNVGKKYSDLLPPNTPIGALRARRNRNGELLNMSQADRIDRATRQLESAENIYRMSLDRIPAVIRHGVPTRGDTLQVGDTISLSRYDGNGRERPEDRIDQKMTVGSITESPNNPDYDNIELVDEDGDIYEELLHKRERVTIFGERAEQFQRATVENIQGVSRIRQREDFERALAEADAGGTWANIPVRPRSQNTPNDRYRGKPWSAPDTVADLVALEELFNMDSDELMEEMQKLDGAWGNGEVTLEMDHVTPSYDGDDGEVSWKGYLYYEGANVGYIQRKYYYVDGELVVYNDYLWIDNEEAKGHGVGTVFYAEMDDWYRRSDVNRMEIQAVQDGSYAWGMAGFGWNPDEEYRNDSAVSNMADRIDGILRDNNVSASTGDRGYGVWEGHELDSDGEYQDEDGYWQSPPEDEIEYGDDGDGISDYGSLSQEMAETLVDFRRRLRDGDSDDWPTPNEMASLRYDTGRKYPAGPREGEPIIDNIGKQIMRDQNWFGRFYFQ